MKIQAWNGSSVFLPQTFVVCVFLFSPQASSVLFYVRVPCCFFHVVSLSFSLLSLCFFPWSPSIFSPILSLDFLLSLPLTQSLSLSLLPSLALTLIPYLSLLPLRSPFSLSFSFSQHSQPLMIDQGFQGLPFPVI